MSLIQDLLGTSKKTFKLGKVGMNIDGTAATANRTMTLPNSNIDMSTGSVNDVLTKTAGGLALQAPSGGTPALLGEWSATQNYVLNNFVVYGASIYRSKTSNLNAIPSSSPTDWELKYGVEYGAVYTGATSLAGTVSRGNILVIGNLTITTNTTINGDLTVIGDIDNGGVSTRSLTVNGSLIANNINLVAAAQSGSVTVQTNLLATGYINLSGVDAATGGGAGQLTICGNGYVTGDIDLRGGNGGATGNGGASGVPTIWGNLTCANLYTTGRDGYSTPIKGGNIIITGSLNALDVECSGGSTKTGGTSAGGAGGTITFGFYSSMTSFTGNGGNSRGTTSAGGAGAIVTATGDIRLLNYGAYSAYGGAALGGGNGGAGGTILCCSFISEGTYSAYGGIGGTTAANIGGLGGIINVSSDFICGATDIYGGTVTTSGAGGSGGAITINGNLRLSGNLVASAGNGVLVGNGGTCNTFSINGKTSAGGATITNNGGSGGATSGNAQTGGTLNFLNTVVADSISANGGSSVSGTAGSAGVINLRGGGAIGTLTTIDGTGTAASTLSGKGVFFNGTLVCQTINVSERVTPFTSTGIGILVASMSALLKVNTLTSRNKLTQGIAGAGVTGVLAAPNASMYSFDGALNWYGHLGAVI
jgi:hypothetical protein